MEKVEASENNALSNDSTDRYFNVLCTCGNQLPFNQSTTELNCQRCQARIAIRYIGHQDPTRGIVENTGWEFIKGISSFQFRMNEWTKELQHKRFEEFQNFANEVYSNHLSLKAKTLDENKRASFVFYQDNKYRTELGPFDITTERGFAEYLFNCVTIQVPDFIFIPGSNYDCPALFEIVINDSLIYYVLHFMIQLKPVNKIGKMTMLSPDAIYLEFFFRMEATNPTGKKTQWCLLDGQLVPIKTFEEHPNTYRIDESKIREVLGEEFFGKLEPLFVSKEKFEDSPDVYVYCCKTEIESELRILGLSDYKDRLFEVLSKSQGCFVVTACMGDKNHSNVMVLRQFRDEVLCKSPGGLRLIKLYSVLGPYLAGLIGRSLALRKMVTFLVVRPVAFLAVRRLMRQLQSKQDIS